MTYACICVSVYVRGLSNARSALSTTRTPDCRSIEGGPLGAVAGTGGGQWVAAAGGPTTVFLPPPPLAQRPQICMKGPPGPPARGGGGRTKEKCTWNVPSGPPKGRSARGAAREGGEGRKSDSSRLALDTTFEIDSKMVWPPEPSA